MCGVGHDGWIVKMRKEREGGEKKRKRKRKRRERENVQLQSNPPKVLLLPPAGPLLRVREQHALTY